MATNGTDDFFKKLQNFFMNLPLYHTYRDFSLLLGTVQKQHSICHHYLESSSENYSAILPICLTVEQILGNIQVKSQHEISDVYNPCKFLSYLLYDKVKNISNENNFDDLYDAIDTMIFEPLNKKNCEIIKFNKEEFDKKKELYYRGETLYWFKKNYENCNFGNVSTCSNYIRECEDFYNKNIETKDCTKLKHYKSELKYFIQNFNETKNILQRNGIEISDKNIPLFEESMCQSESKSTELEQKPIVHLGGDQQELYHSGSFTDQTLNLEDYDVGTNNSAGIVLGTMTGIFLLFFIPYKFTPFGAWLKNKFNLEHKTNEFSLNNSANENVDLYNEIYNIKYSSAGDS
ncbi:PIR protein [Plasmodium ovale]|uniref:PIR protein n=1 Tax=Plasmodium ovale TaxID=36330 RepID=A0A1C3KJQ7_PLAOA|nr:PIR protein [Plasmodium ovale]